MTGMTAPTPDLSARLRHDGAAGEIFAIHLKNIMLEVLTLGFYHSWAKTRIRRYLWSQTRYLDDPLEYTGTGGELFKGVIIVSLLLALIYALYEVVAFMAATNVPEVEVVLNIVLVTGVVMLVGVAKFRARRYRLSRTVWRGIRFAQTGSAIEYGFRYLGYWLVTLLTLGFFWPFMDVALTRYRLNNTWFGNRRLHFEGSGRDLLKPFTIAWLLFLPTLGFSWFWYRAAEFRYRGATDVRGAALMRLAVTNGLITVFTLSLAYPYVLVRIARFACDSLDVIGEQDFARVAQSLEKAPGFGEGLEAALDIGDF